MAKKDTNISFDELMAEIDKYKIKQNKSTLTEQQKKFILKCRVGNEKVIYEKMCELWDRLGWGSVSLGTMRNNAIKVLKEYGKR